MARTFFSNNKPPPPPPPPENSSADPPLESSNLASQASEKPPPLPQSRENDSSSSIQRTPASNSQEPLATQKPPSPPIGSNQSLAAMSARADQRTLPPQVGARLVPNHKETKPAPAYTRLFPHPRDLLREQGMATPLVLPRSSAFAKLESSLPPLMGFEELDQLDPLDLDQPTYDPHRGVAPSEINSRATSLALASAQSTPVPLPVDRQDFLVTRREAPTTPQPTVPLQMPTPRARARESAPPMTPSPNQLILREMTKAPQPQDQVTTMSNILQGQWLLYVNAHEKNDLHMMRIALDQAIITQDALETMIGTEKMLEIADGWSARGEIAHLNLAPRPTLHQPSDTSSHHQRPMVIEATTYPSTQTVYTSPDTDTHMRPATASQHMMPPPPPPPIVEPRPIRPSTGPQDGQNLVALHPMAPPIPPRLEELNYQPHQAEQQYHQEMDRYFAQRHHGHQQYPPQQELSMHNPQSFHPRNQGYSGPPQHRGNHPYHRPFQRNWQRRPDPISSMMEMGNFLMRAEQVMGRMQRLRNRGGRGYRAGNRGNNQFHHPPNFPQ
ncbi:hypothetical protein PCANC_15985 [Puccinia coronata f. sp. avenae]|uniref:Uncharacterized protein n=1 Tax=Puccinia coronata f. sp. avenae TaxID=200324 RepID=A0A2N5VQ32_9BASI|nr:hypothetical protein PCASD_02143 [Puccinia coronata f. sp. avenae]PLW52733.1 hypothetical protein PCANC_15985 [Puccinia coronata f. sp. avenae]